MAMALAPEGRQDGGQIFLIHLGFSHLDEEVLTARVREIPFGGLILLEGINILPSTHERVTKDPECTLRTDLERPSKVTLTFILALLDGQYTNQEIVIILTMNYPDFLDRALVREQRVGHIQVTKPVEDMIPKLMDPQLDNPSLSSSSSLKGQLISWVEKGPSMAQICSILQSINEQEMDEANTINWFTVRIAQSSLG
ncbi:mitochondrial chaperone BCS1 [Apiospora arundinis]